MKPHCSHWISLLILVLQSPHAASPACRISLMQSLRSPSSANRNSPRPPSQQKAHQQAGEQQQWWQQLEVKWKTHRGVVGALDGHSVFGPLDVSCRLGPPSHTGQIVRRPGHQQQLRRSVHHRVLGWDCEGTNSV